MEIAEEKEETDEDEEGETSKDKRRMLKRLLYRRWKQKVRRLITGRRRLMAGRRRLPKRRSQQKMDVDKNYFPGVVS